MFLFLQIFVPLFHDKHFSLIVVNLQNGSFDCLDSMTRPTGNPVEEKVIANMRQYLAERFDISDVDTWPQAVLPVRQQKNTYDCGFRLMLHMIHYRTKDMNRIDEVSAGKSCLLLSFLLVFYLVLP